MPKVPTFELLAGLHSRSMVKSRLRPAASKGTAQLSCGSGIQMKEKVPQPEKWLKDKEKKNHLLNVTQGVYFQFLSAAKYRFWGAGNWLVEIQNVYVLCARVGARLPSLLCLAQGHSIPGKETALERNILCFSRQMQDPSAQNLANSARNKF